MFFLSAFSLFAFNNMSKKALSLDHLGSFYHSSNARVLNQSKFKAPADNKINVTKNLKFGMVENIFDRAENTCY